MQLDFETGKLHAVARSIRPDRKREYRLLAVVLLLASTPYVVAFVFWPLETVILAAFLGYFQVLITFATSTATDTAHAIRFLLAGSNPIGMTGSSSLLFGAVDAIVDWREDAAERKRNGAKFWLLCFYKFLMTPIGCLLMVSEYCWDCVLMRPRLVRLKWNELFALAEFHDLVSPEKSNDVFYADLAYARFRADPYLYQWNRLRSMVFELEHYRIDAVAGIGFPETNLFFQSETAAYQTLKRLQLEAIETAIASHDDANEDWLPFPARIAERLTQNARPIAHYLRMRQSLLGHSDHQSEFDHKLSELLGETDAGRYRTWFILRWLDSEASTSDYIDAATVNDLVDAGVFCDNDKGPVLSEAFQIEFEQLLDRYWQVASPDEIAKRKLDRVPEFLAYGEKTYVAKSQEPRKPE